jgi:hypothetical protein
VVEYLTSKCEALSSNPSTTKKKKKITCDLLRCNLAILPRLVSNLWAQVILVPQLSKELEL